MLERAIRLQLVMNDERGINCPSLLFVTILLSAQMGLSAGESGDAASLNVDSAQEAFFAEFNEELRNHPDLTSINTSGIPERSMAINLLSSNYACAVAVGGVHAATVVAEIRKVRFFSLSFPAAMRLPDGRSLAIFALTNPVQKAILLFDSFAHPDSAKAIYLPGQDVHALDLLPLTEISHRFVRGSLTVTRLRLLFLLHEFGHVTGALPNDSTSLCLSMSNTYRIAAACMPDVVANPVVDVGNAVCSAAHRSISIRLGVARPNRAAAQPKTATDSSRR
jgi:hypothetical protein